MNVFISSVFGGFEEFRNATREAIDYVRTSSGVPLSPIGMDKDTPALSVSPQTACLDAVRAADIFVLILGSRYGFINPESHLSATHEEFREAKRTRKPIFVFIQTGISSYEPEQESFINEVSHYCDGFLRRTFETAQALRLEVEHAVTAYLRDHPVSSQNPDRSSQTVINHGEGAVIAQTIHTINITRGNQN